MAAEIAQQAPAAKPAEAPRRRDLDEEIEDFCTFDPGAAPTVERLDACDRLKKNQRDRQRLRSEARRESMKGWVWLGFIVFFVVSVGFIVWALVQTGIVSLDAIGAFFGSLGELDLGGMFNGTISG